MHAFNFSGRGRLSRRQKVGGKNIADGATNIFLFCRVSQQQKTGTFYTDATGALHVVLLDGMQYFFFAYDYDANYIFSEPIPDVKDATIVQAFDKIFTKLTKKGHNPTFNVTDNQPATPLKAYLKTEGNRWQFVEPHNHQVNTVEQAIQMFKNKFGS